MIRHYRNDLTPNEYYENYVKTWIEECGATVIGGCCGIFPEHIKYAHDRVRGILKEAQKERTFSIFTPGTEGAIEQLEQAFQKQGLKIVAMKHVNIDEALFSEHQSDLIKEKTRNSVDRSVCCMVLEGNDAVKLGQMMLDTSMTTDSESEDGEVA